jgi:biopolymer transport protein ExbD
MSAEDQARMTVSIKADRDVPMGMIADVKQALQESYALKVNYAATERKDNKKQP